MTILSFITICAIVFCYHIMLFYFWCKKYTNKLSIIAIMCRLLWTIPILAVLYPKNTYSVSTLVKTSNYFNQITVFIDDSASMYKNKSAGVTFYDYALDLVENLTKQCQKHQCKVDVVMASALDKTFNQNYSFLTKSIDSFVKNYQSNGYLLIISDGGASNPDFLSNFEFAKNKDDLQDAIMFAGWNFNKDKYNVALTDLNLSEFLFSENKIKINAKLISTQAKLPENTSVQLRVLVDGKLNSSKNFKINHLSDQTNLYFVIPALDIGVHYIQLEVLALAGESETWDNKIGKSIEILPNSINTLHLLGSPSADGRFLRRLLKTDKRFELLSFYILRDPWDMTAANSKELSLIPFPVNDLFVDYLKSFDLVIMQNFRLNEFLSKQYQANIIDYLETGGSMMIIGGPRAYHPVDLLYSSVFENAPFFIDKKLIQSYIFSMFESSLLNTKKFKGSLYYDPNISFFLKSPDGNANFVKYKSDKLDKTDKLTNKTIQDNNYFLDNSKNYNNQLNDLIFHSSELVDFSSYFLQPIKLYGMNNTKNIKFFADRTISLVNAEIITTEINKKTNSANSFITPLVNASFVGKGRIIWIYTDALWQLAMAAGARLTYARSTYNQFMLSLIRWLSRDEKTPAIVIDSFNITPKNFEFDNAQKVGNGLKKNKNLYNYQLSAYISGVGSKYLLANNSKLALDVCNKKIKDFEIIKISDHYYNLVADFSYNSLTQDVFNLTASKNFNASLQSSMICKLQLDFYHRQFGNEVLIAKKKIAKIYDDDQNLYSWSYLKNLAKIFNAQLIDLKNIHKNSIRQTVGEVIKNSKAHNLKKNSNNKNSMEYFVDESYVDPYKLFASKLIYIFFMGLFFEVIFRKRLLF